MDGTYDGAYVGVLTHSRTTNTGKAAPTSDTVNSYTWWDSAKILTTAVTPDVTQPGTVNTSAYIYDSAGNLTGVRIQDGQPRTIELVNNAQGEVIKRDVVYDSGITAPHELHYYVGGMAAGPRMIAVYRGRVSGTYASALQKPSDARTFFT